MMIKVFTCLFLGMCHVQAQNDFKTGTIHFSNAEINFGVIEKGSNPFRELTITNTGDYPLIVNSCRASCGCTVPNCPIEPIPAKKKAVIKVRYNTHIIGPFSKTITVYSNDQKTPISLIKIYGEVVDTLATKQTSTP